MMQRNEAEKVIKEFLDKVSDYNVCLVDTTSEWSDDWICLDSDCCNFSLDVLLKEFLDKKFAL